MVLSDDEVRLIRLFRVLNHERSDILVQATKEAMKSYTLDPSIVRCGNAKEALADELNPANCRGYEAFYLRLKVCLYPLIDEYVWLGWMEGYIDEIIETAWSDSVVEVLLGDSDSDVSHADRLREAIHQVYEDHRPLLCPDKFKWVSSKYLVKFIRDWRQQVVSRLEQKIGTEYFAKKPIPAP